jgi:hypothetical protein
MVGANMGMVSTIQRGMLLINTHVAWPVHAPPQRRIEGGILWC